MYTPEIRNTLDMGSLMLGNGNDNVLSITKYAYVKGVPMGTTVDIWDDSGSDLVYMVNGDTLDISSTSVDDVGQGAGAWTVLVAGLDVNGDLLEEVVTLNGTTIVTTVNTFYRVYRMAVVTSGDITGTIGVIKAIGEGTEQAITKPIVNSTRMSHFTIPRGYVGFISDVYISGGPNDDFVAQLRTRVNAPNTCFVTATDVEISNSNIFVAGYTPMLGPISAMTDVKVSVTAINNNAAARISYTFVCVREEYLNRYVEQMK
jgi:hypothetical protein